MRKPLIIANWKMNTNLADATVIATQVKNKVGDFDVDVVLAPPSIWLYSVAEVLEKSPKNIELSAQNIWFTENGAVTGEISAEMVKSLAKYVIIGHSERRRYFHETDELINDKILGALKHGLTPILCVGELKKQIIKRGKGRPNNTDVRSDVIRQLRGALDGISRKDAEEIIIAYEPVWAIGTGEAATGAYAAEVIGNLRKFLTKKYSRTMSERVRILYGGSVDTKNIREFTYQPEIDGALVGGASLKAKEFIEICREAAGKD